MLTNRAIERLAGGLLVASFVAFLGHVITLIVLGAGPVTIFLVLVYGLLIFLSAATLYLIFGPHDRSLALFGATGLAAHGVFIVIVCAMILAQFEFAQEFPATDGAEGQSVAAAGRALELAMDKIRTSAFVFMGLGLMPLGALIAWSTRDSAEISPLGRPMAQAATALPWAAVALIQMQLSIRLKASRWPPASQTETLMLMFISLAFAIAALIMRSASSNVSAMCLPPGQADWTSP